MADVKGIFDGYDVGIRYADDAVGQLVGQRVGERLTTAPLALGLGEDHEAMLGRCLESADSHDDALTHYAAALELQPGDRLLVRVRPDRVIEMEDGH